MDRALVSGTRGREFESRIARHKEIKGLRQKRGPFFVGCPGTIFFAVLALVYRFNRSDIKGTRVHHVLECICR